MPPTPLSEHVAAEVRAHLGRQRKSQAWLGEQMGLNGATISRLLAGKRSFAVDDLAAVADALGVTVESLLPTAERRAS